MSKTLTNGWYVCKKCKEYFHPDWLDDHKESHITLGDKGN